MMTDGEDKRIVYGTGDGYLICLHAGTGKLVEGFGEKGRIDLTQGLDRPVERRLYGVSSPPVICRICSPALVNWLRRNSDWIRIAS